MAPVFLGVTLDANSKVSDLLAALRPKLRPAFDGAVEQLVVTRCNGETGSGTMNSSYSFNLYKPEMLKEEVLGDYFFETRQVRVHRCD